MNPNAWKFGRTFNKEFSGVKSFNCFRHASTLLKIFSCVKGTALGSPVVPEVEKITANFLSSSSAGAVTPVKFSEPVIFSKLNLEQRQPEFFKESSSSFLTPSDKATAKGFNNFKVFNKEISPVFSFNGQNTPPSFHVAYIKASAIGEFGIKTASLCPSEKPDFLKTSAHSSASFLKRVALHHSFLNQQQFFSGYFKAYSSIFFASKIFFPPQIKNETQNFPRLFYFILQVFCSRILTA